MNILSTESLSKAYSEKDLFKEIKFGIEDTDKIGLIGINGTGKSTLLKIIAGLEQSDKGDIIKASGINIEYLPQNPDFDHESKVIEQVFKGSSPLMVLLREYEEVVEKLQKTPDDKTLQEKLISLNPKMDSMDAWHLEREAKAVLTKLGIYDFEEKIGNLSGGQRKRVSMAGALIRPSDLLILDEPTNHIDNETIEFLEEYLKTRKGALLMVTHDRYFLNRVVNRIWEIEKGKLYSYQGSYTKFLELKEQREHDERKIQDKKESLYKSELAWIRKGVEARRTKQKARKERFKDLEQEVQKSSEEKMDISVAGRRLGKKIIEIDSISKTFDSKTVIRDFTYTVLRDDRIGIVGKNGEGKSTLLNAITKTIELDRGIVDIGETIKIGYYSQENLDMNPNLRVIEYIKEKAEYISTGDGTKITASQMLERFMFSSDMQYAYISKLSGGERRRLYLLSVLMESPNVLLLDEPTNDLDIQTLAILEDYIEEFPGPVITVSHDRYFLDKTCDKIFAYEGNGKIEIYHGDYSDYATKRNLNQKKEYAEEKESKSSKEEKEVKSQEKPQKKTKFSYKEQKEYEEIDEKIEKTEAKLSEVKKEIEKSGSDFIKLNNLLKEEDELSKDLEHLMERWAYLTEMAEEMGLI